MNHRFTDKSATLNIRVSPEVKRQAEEVLDLLGIPMSTAIDMYLRQIALTGGIPFDLTVPVKPANVHSRDNDERQLDTQMRDDYRAMVQSRIRGADAAAAYRDTNRHNHDD